MSFDVLKTIIKTAEMNAVLNYPIKVYKATHLKFSSKKKKPKNIVINIHRLCHLLCSRESMREYMGNKIIKYSTELQHLLTE